MPFLRQVKLGFISQVSKPGWLRHNHRPCMFSAWGTKHIKTLHKIQSNLVSSFAMPFSIHWKALSCLCTVRKYGNGGDRGGERKIASALSRVYEKQHLERQGMNFKSITITIPWNKTAPFLSTFPSCFQYLPILLICRAILNRST